MPYKCRGAFTRPCRPTAARTRARAARGWIAKGDAQSLVQAARLADALPDAERAELTAVVRACLPDDELNLTAKPT